MPSPISDSEILVKVENVSKKFCRSLKKSLWYGVQDIAHELNPFSPKTENRGQKTGINGSEGQNVSRPSQNQTSDFESQLSAPNIENESQLSQFPISDLPTGLRDGEFWAVNNVSFELR